jgi:hypothetical protein
MAPSYLRKKFRSVKNLLPAFALVALVGAGCAPADSIKQQAQQAVNTAAEKASQASEKATELAAEEAYKKAGKDIDVSVGKDTWSITDPKTGQVIVAGENVTIPDGFPKDILIYPNGKVTSVQVISKDKDAALLATTMDSQATVRDWYIAEAEKSGWKKDRELEGGGQFALVFNRTEADGSVTKFNVILASKSYDGSLQITLTRDGK